MTKPEKRRRVTVSEVTVMRSVRKGAETGMRSGTMMRADGKDAAR